MTEPRAIPRRPWRSLNAFSASPIRVPLDQSGAVARGALDGALGMAAAQRAREAGEPRRERERLDRRAAAGGRGEQLQVGAGVGLHRAGDVAQQHQAAALHAAAAVREADRLAAAAQAAAERPAQVDRAAVAAALVAARAPQRRRELEPRHQPVELRELARLERVEAAARQPLLVAGHRARDLDLARPSPRRARAPVTGRLLLAARRRAAASARSRPSRAPPPAPKTARKTASNAATCAWSETNTRAGGPVQAAAARPGGRGRARARTRPGARG